MKDQCFARLEALIAEARRLRVSRFDEQEPEAATCHELILPLLDAFGFHKEHIKPEFRILGDAVDYLLKSERPLLFVEAKSLLDPAENLFSAHKEQVLRYIRNYRVSPEQTQMDRPVTWILLTNFAQFHFVRVNEDAPAFSFTLDQLWRRREELWELLARENVEAGHLEEVYDQRHKATLDQRFLADLKRWRLMFANGFKLRNQTRSLEEITLASQQLLNRFLFDRMLETHRLIEWNKLARAYQHYETFYGDFTEKTFAAYLRESLFSEIKFKFNTELFRQPLLCDTLPLDNGILSVLVGHEPLSSNIAATCGFGSGTGELLAFRHLYSYDFSLMSPDVMGAVYERFLAHKLSQSGGRIVIEDTDELRKKEGIYYTPKYIVDYIVAQTLGEKIKPILAEAKALLGYKNFKGALAKIRELSQIKVLDPAMGSGSFLLGAFDALLAAYADYNAACQRHQREHNGGGTLFDAPDEIATTVEHAAQLVLTENLHGVDLDAQALEVAKLNFWIRYMAVERDAMRERIRFEKGRTTALNLLPTLIANFKHGNSLIADANVAGDAAFDWAKEFPEIVGQASSLSPSGKAESETGATPVLRGGFDVVIGNPPYERIQTMQAHAPQAVEFLKANYRSAASGNFDIYVCFVECGLQLLKPDGVFGYICPHKFFQAEYGRELRTLLTEGRQVREILSFGDQQVFPQATTYTCLLFLQRQPQDNPVFIKVDDVEAWRQTGEAAIGKIAPVSFAGDQWNFVLGNGAELFAKLNQSPVRLRDVAERIAQGLRTSANPVYVLDLRSISGQTVTAFSEQLQREVRLERKAVALFLQGQDIRRYFLESCSKVVILPYQIKAGRAELISETHLRKKLPLTYEYLRENKKPLEGREDGRMRGEQWYAFVYPKNLELMAAAKILVPDIASFASFAFDETGEFAFASGYGITLKADAMESPAYLLGLLNSRLLDFYLKQVSTTMRGGYFRYFTQFIEQLPIRRIDPQKKAEAKLEREIVARVEQIQFAYRQRVKLPEVLTRLIAHDASRAPCSLAHYLQTEFAAAVQPEILIDDAQRTGFVHAVVIEAEGKALTLSATVTAKADAEPQPLPLLRLAFKDDALRQFIYACWQQFLAEHSRQKRWTKGKKPEAVYALLVNTLEPLVYFAPAAGDNLRAIHDVMKAVEQEAGSADLAALEAEIARLDREIDARVYELYGLTPEEIRIVEGGK
jgi:type I restriction-modification system DNA methylase subunit